MLLLFAIATFVVWLLAAMSDEADYTYRYGVRYTGYDTLGCVCTYADTELVAIETSTGFRAFRRSIENDDHRVLAIDVEPYFDGAEAVLDQEALHAQLDSLLLSQRVSKVAFVGNGLRIAVAPRESKRVPVVVRDLDLAFASQYGLGGNPTVRPDSVTLYGSAAALEQVSEVSTARLRLSGIDRSQLVKVPLRPVWDDYCGMCADCSEVEIDLPVRRFVERLFLAKVHCAGSDSVRLYPDQVKVHCWVPTELYDEVQPADIRVVACAQDDKMIPKVVSFPSGVRIKQIQPSELQYVIIKGEK